MTERASETKGLDWLREFERRNGRRLRVLHIGNIANNAYNNAKIQRRRGIDADVSCHDYYHVMASPEWEDAPISGDVADQLFPDWWSADVGSFRRPDWFVQGNWRTCQRYLLARARGDDRRVALLRRLLTIERWLWSRSTSVARALGYRRGAAKWLRVSLGVARVGARKAGDVLCALWLLAGRRTDVRGALATAFPTRMARFGAAADVDTTDLGRRFADRFPSRPPLARRDMEGYRLQAAGWSPVVEHYDIVQGYSLEAIVPLLCGASAWTAYEHGTLRKIPFEDTPTGRIAALAFSEAPVVFVTNSDVVEAARLLGLPEDRVVCLPHAVDSDRLFAFAREHRALLPRPGEPISFFAASRQDWVDGDVSWAKGNDRFLRAAASLRGSFEFRLVLAEWGRDLEASRELIARLGLEPLVEWVSPLPKAALWARFLSCHAVVDQFSLAAIGGVTFEAMALGRRVITALDAEQTTQFFGEAPPLLAAHTEDEIVHALVKVLEDPLDEVQRGPAARAWFERFHSADRVTGLQALAYRRLLEMVGEA